MDVRISARHCSITDSVREVAHARVSRLTRFEPRAAAAEVQFTNDTTAKRVEVRLHVPGASHVHAHGLGDTFRTALDRSVERLERQLRRRRARVRDHQAAPAADTFGAVNTLSMET